MDELRKLYDVLHEKQMYTRSFDDFREKYSTPINQDKLFNVLSERQLYTKSNEDFKGKYFQTAPEVVEEAPEKKKSRLLQWIQRFLQKNLCPNGKDL